MSGIKKFFGTPIKAFVSIIIIVIVVLILELGYVFAYRAFAKGKSNAEQIALSDSGANASEARFSRTKLSFGDGEFVYEVEFFTHNGDYEYTIAASDGRILDRDIDGVLLPLKNSEVSSQIPAKSTREISKAQSETVPGSEPTMGNDNSSLVSEDIGFDRAKEIALEHAGLKNENVMFKEAKPEWDDGLMVYEIEFIFGQDEYEYKIQASDGKILDYDVEHDNGEHNIERGHH